MINQLARDRRKSAIIAGARGQDHDAFLESIKRDLHGLGLLLIFLLVLLLRGLVILLLAILGFVFLLFLLFVRARSRSFVGGLVALLPVRVLLLVRLLLFVLLLILLLFGFVVVARRERRRNVLSQWHAGQLGAVRVNPGGIEIAIGGIERPAGDEVEIFPIWIEDRIAVVVKTGRDLMPRVVLQIINDDGRVAILQVAGVSDPPTVRRPAHAEAGK